MMNEYEMKAVLNQRKKLLEEIKANTETQLRFIGKREIRGLQRLQKEREKKILALSDLKHEHEDSEVLWQDDEQELLMPETKILENEILALAAKAHSEALVELGKIGAELKQIGIKKTILRKYLRQRAYAVSTKIDIKR